MSDELKETPAPAPAPETPPKPGIIERLATALDRALAQPVKRTGWERTCWMILDCSGGQHVIATKDELAKLSAWQKQWDKAYEVTAIYGHESAKKEHALHVQKLGASIHDGSLNAISGRTFESIVADHEAKQSAAKEDMVRIHAEAGQLCMEIGARFCRLADKFITGKEANEKFHHEQFGIPYQPSALIRSLKEARKIAWLRSEPIERGNLPPRMMTPFLDF